MLAGIGSGVAVFLMLGGQAAPSPPQIGVKITQRYLEPVCVDGAPVKPGTRQWRLNAGEHSLVATMRNDPRPGAAPHQQADAEGAPGTAVVSFTLEAGHKYEVEVRASPTSFSSRAWTRGDWKPVVRDRTTDRVVSGDPQWIDSSCAK